VAESGRDAHRGGLAGAVRPQETDDFAGLDLEADAFDGALAGVHLGQTIGDDHSGSEVELAQGRTRASGLTTKRRL
jgi:hypothetical protein